MEVTEIKTMGGTDNSITTTIPRFAKIHAIGRTQFQHQLIKPTSFLQFFFLYN